MGAGYWDSLLLLREVKYGAQGLMAVKKSHGKLQYNRLPLSAPYVNNTHTQSRPSTLSSFQMQLFATAIPGYGGRGKRTGMLTKRERCPIDRRRRKEAENFDRSKKERDEKRIPLSDDDARVFTHADVNQVKSCVSLSLSLSLWFNYLSLTRLCITHERASIEN